MCRASTRGRVVEGEEHLGAVIQRLPDGADDRGGFAAFGDGHQHVARAEPRLLHLVPAEDVVILEVLDRADQGVIAAGHDAHDPVFQRGQLRRDGRMPRCSSCQNYARRPPAGCSAGRSRRSRRSRSGRWPSSARRRASTSRGNSAPAKTCVALGSDIGVDRLQHANGRFQVALGRLRQAGRPGVRLLRGQHSQVKLLLVVDEVLRLAVGFLEEGVRSRLLAGRYAGCLRGGSLLGSSFTGPVMRARP